MGNKEHSKWVETTCNAVIEQTARSMVDRGYADMGHIINASAHFVNFLSKRPFNEIVDAIYAEAKRVQTERKAA